MNRKLKASDILYKVLMFSIFLLLSLNYFECTWTYFCVWQFDVSHMWKMLFIYFGDLESLRSAAKLCVINVLIILGWILSDEKLASYLTSHKPLSFYSPSQFLPLYFKIVCECPQIGVPHQLYRFTLWSRWYPSFQNNAYAQGTETTSCHVSYARNEGT